MQWARKFWLLTLACRKRLKLLKILFLASVLWSKITPDRQLFVRKKILAKNTILHPLTVGSPSSEDPDLDSLLKNMDVLAGFRFCRVFHCESLWIRNIKNSTLCFNCYTVVILPITTDLRLQFCVVVFPKITHSALNAFMFYWCLPFIERGQ